MKKIRELLEYVYFLIIKLILLNFYNFKILMRISELYLTNQNISIDYNLV